MTALPGRPKHWSRGAPKPGKTLVVVKCMKCTRFWFNLIGSAEGVLHRVQGYTEAEYDPATRRAGRYSPRTGRSSASNVVVERHAGPPDGTVTTIATVAIPNRAYSRYLVRCHPRCGVRKPVLLELLNREFAGAVTRGHSEVGL